jgi:hypothetical protein
LSVLLVAKLTDPRLTAELGIPTPDRKIRAIHADAVLAAVERLIGAATDAVAAARVALSLTIS